MPARAVRHWILPIGRSERSRSICFSPLLRVNSAPVPFEIVSRNFVDAVQFGRGDEPANQLLERLV